MTPWIFLLRDSRSDQTHSTREVNVRQRASVVVVIHFSIEFYRDWIDRFIARKKKQHTPSITINKMSENAASGMVEVAWSGKKLYIQASKLDEWREQSFEQRDAWVANHPWAVAAEAPMYHPTFEGAKTDSDDDIDEDIKKLQKPKKKEPEGLSDYVVVHWNGKSLLLPRKDLDDWYENKSPEDRLDYIQSHPDVEIKM